MNWYNKWQKRISKNNILKEQSLKLMKNTNPVIIPRNHIVEKVLTAANEDNLKQMNKLLSILHKPYDKQAGIENYQSSLDDKHYQTFCGT